MDKQGNTKYDTLTKFSQRTGKTHPDLISPEISDEVMYIWTWFQELNCQRTSNGFGLNPITFLEIQAWANMTHKSPTAWEISALRAIDMTWINKMSDSQKTNDKIK